jgi:hypothetical protein
MKIQNDLYTIKCAIKVCINFVNIFFMYLQFIVAKNWIKVHINYFF